MSFVQSKLDALIAVRPAPSFLEKRFLVREMLEGILEEGHRSAERASLASGKPFVVLEPGPEDAPPYVVKVNRANSALVQIDGELVVHGRLRGLTGGGLPVRLLPGADGTSKTYSLSLSVDWGEESTFRESRRVLLMLEPGEEPEFQAVPFPVSEAVLSFAVPIEVLEFSPAESKWASLGWYPVDALNPTLCGSIKEDERLAQSIDSFVSRLQERLDRSVAPRLLMLCNVLFELATLIRAASRQREALHIAIEKAKQIVVGCLDLYPPSSDEDDGLRAAVGLWRLPARERLSLGTYFSSPLKDTLQDLVASAERLTYLAEGQDWRVDVDRVARAEWGDRYPIQTSEHGVEDYIVQAKLQPFGPGEVVLHDFELAPSETSRDVVLLSIEGIAGTRAAVPLEFSMVDSSNHTERWSVMVEPTEDWSNFVWGVELRRCEGAQFRVKLRNQELASRWKLDGLCLRRA